MARDLTLWFPTSVHNLGRSIEYDQRIAASCTRCGFWKEIDIAKLMAIKGPAYCLIDRRSRCKQKPGCTGWIRFLYLRGVFRPLWTDHAIYRWIELDYMERQARRPSDD